MKRRYTGKLCVKMEGAGAQKVEYLLAYTSDYKEEKKGEILWEFEKK